MNPPNNDGWRQPPGPIAPPPNNEPNGQAQQRLLNGFGSSHASHHGLHGQAVLPPPSVAAPFYSSTQPGAHALSTLTGLGQPTALHPTQGHTPSLQQQQQQQQQQAPPPPPPTGVPPPSQGPSYSLPTLGQAMQHQSPTALNADREREMRDRELRDRDARDRHRQQDEIAQRERDLQREHEQRERQQREQPQAVPLQSQAGSIPIHQPVASRIQTTIHGPNGLLSHLGTNASAGPPMTTVNISNGPSNIFGGPVPPNEGTPKSFIQQTGPGSTPQQQMLAFGATPGPHPLPVGVTALPQGQQPILNDALSYLDQVKVQFVDQPDVYNRFLDIMKDFKSQAIDTPGVIERVSTLFAGHPNLIQGFNTFLPPGYRIECGAGDDPNAIRVTTPQGTTVSSMPTGFRPLNDALNGVTALNGNGPPGRQVFYDQAPRTSNGNWTQHPQSSDGPFSPSGLSAGPSIFSQSASQPQGHGSQFDAQVEQEQQAAAARAHQQEQRGVSQLQNAVSAATNGTNSGQAMMQSSPVGAQANPLGQALAGMNGAGSGLSQPGQVGLEKRGPVEFNHAISYVNKIKNRFSSQPEIYKQFLEILQTYQRESKPIQDVYAQVTELFKSAPDLLEDFKQFLPESAAQAKAQAAARQAAEDAVMLSNVRGEPNYIGGAPNAQVQTPSREIKMPPVGNFAPPPSAGKENKKRRGGAGSQITGGAAAQVASMMAEAGSGTSLGHGGRGLLNQGGNANKRSKLHHTKSTQPDAPTVSPTLTPALPEPLPPTITSGATTEEIAFFDRAKKFIGNKQTMNEFLKLCNLFSMDLIDVNVLVHKVASFLGGNPELMNWFKKFVRYTGKDETIENRAKAPTGRVSLSNCRGLGPSYRLLPKRERMKICSGRDEMCYQVLNDEWASHPTWASEDSGFVAHRKNIFEEGLHRIEEERHDYDFNIETCLRTIQLLEPIVQQIKIMSPDERAAFVLPPGIGGQSETIYQRVIKKIYDRERGQKVIDDMFLRPTAVVPIVLARLKQKAEEWKASQREWEKVWREQTQKMFWKSLDHQGIHAKTVDKKQFQAKTLQNEIQARYEEQKRQRIVPWSTVPKYQFQYTFDDTEIILDAARLLLTYIDRSHSINGADQSKLEVFVKDFIPTFFGLDREKFQQHMSDVYDNSPPNEDVEDDSQAAEEVSAPRGRRAANGKKTDLLRGVLERGRTGKPARKEKEGSAISGSKESTPDVTSVADEELAGPGDSAAESGASMDMTDFRWMDHPTTGNFRGKRDIQPNEPYRRDTYTLYCNLNIYCFFRMFEILYERLAHIKANEKQVHEDVRRAKAPKAAHDLRMVDRSPSDFFVDTSNRANYYQQIVKMCEEVLKTELDMSHLEETLRRFYMQNGWQLYTFDKLLSATVRFAISVLGSDNKDKSSEIFNLFLKDREKEETTYRKELDYRKQVEKLTKEGDVYRINFTQPTMQATVQIFKKSDATFDTDTMSTEAKWSYYVASFVTRDPTEGVPLSWPFLKRNLPPQLDEAEYNRDFTPQWSAENLTVRICLGSYRVLFEPGTEDWWVHGDRVRARGREGVEVAREERKGAFEEKFVMNNGWMRGLSKDEVDRKKEEYRRWIRDGPAAATAGGAAGVKVGEEGGMQAKGDGDDDEDQVMLDA